MFPYYVYDTIYYVLFEYQLLLEQVCIKQSKQTNKYKKKKIWEKINTNQNPF